MRALGVAVCAVLALTGSTALGAGRSGTLAVVDREPLTIRGSRFLPREQVTLLVSAPVPLTRTLRAGSRGGVTTVLRLRLDRCDELVVQAIGSRGTRAQLDVGLPACAPSP